MNMPYAAVMPRRAVTTTMRWQTIAVCLPFALADSTGIVASMRSNLSIVALSGILCGVVALCCDNWPQDGLAPRRLRIYEAAACAAVMVFGTSFIYFAGMLPATIPAVSSMNLLS